MEGCVYNVLSVDMQELADSKMKTSRHLVPGLAGSSAGGEFLCGEQ